MELDEFLAALAGSDEPSIAYKARVQLLGEDPAAPDVVQLRDAIRCSARVRALLAERGSDGTIPHHPYAKWYGAHWVLVALADLDYPADDIELILLREQVYALLFSAGGLRSITRHTRDR